jgi:hypothetical protein
MTTAVVKKSCPHRDRPPRDDVAGQRGVGTIDGVVRRERSLVHADVAVVDRNPRARMPWSPKST